MIIALFLTGDKGGAKIPFLVADGFYILVCALVGRVYDIFFPHSIDVLNIRLAQTSKKHLLLHKILCKIKV